MKHKIELNGLSFYAFHGYHQHEREKGNIFELNIKIITDITLESDNEDDLKKTIDYEAIYAIAKEEMAKSSKLLETVVSRITKKIFSDQRVLKITVSLAKTNPPIGGPCNHTVVSTSMKRQSSGKVLN